MPGTERVGALQAAHDLPLVHAVIARCEQYLQYAKHERADVRLTVTNLIARMEKERARLEWAVEHDDLGDGHGTVAMYSRSCRCTPCKRARSEYDRERVKAGLK